jgi:hypothetical protein
MAIHLELIYGKKLGLPQYSSHNFSVSLKSEVPSHEDIPAEVERVYRILQKSVDEQIVHPGLIPGMEDTPSNVVQMPTSQQKPANGDWTCSPKQKELILKLVDENQLDRHEVDQLAQERFGHGVTQLNKLEASGLIDELMKRAGREPVRKRGAAVRRAA